MQKKIIYVIAIVITGIGFWLYSAGRNDVSDLGNRADTTRNELESISQEQRNQAATLDRAAEKVDNSREAVRESQERSSTIQSIEQSDAALIKQSQSILAEIRERGKKESTN